MSIVIIVVLVIALIFIRGSISDDAEKTGMNICPRCGHKMDMKVNARYHCTHCGYNKYA